MKTNKKFKLSQRSRIRRLFGGVARRGKMLIVALLLLTQFLFIPPLAKHTEEAPGTIAPVVDNKNQPDIILAQRTDDKKFHFPDIAKLNDGKLVAVAYLNSMHVPGGAADPMGRIVSLESTDNGETWSTPEVIVDLSAQQRDPRDPNLTVLPDGTLIMTYFAKHYPVSGAANPTINKLRFSNDGGNTWYQEIDMESEILSLYFAKRGSIACLSNNEILVPIYGKGPGTSTTPGYHRDSVVLRYEKINGSWTKTGEHLIDRDIEEAAVYYDAKRDVLWGMAGVKGNIYRSADRGETWEIVTREEPRVYDPNFTTSSMGEQQLVQPRIIGIDEERVLFVFGGHTVLNYAEDRSSHPVFGKMFYPAAGWHATLSRTVYDRVGKHAPDMGDASAVYTQDGRILFIAYDTALKAIVGKWSDPDDWPAPGDEGEWRFLSAELDATVGDSPYPTDILASADPGRFSIVDGSLRVTPGTGDTETELHSVTEISGNYKSTFSFRLNGAAGSLVLRPQLYTAPAAQIGTGAQVILSATSVEIRDKDGNVLAESTQGITTGQWYDLRLDQDYDQFALWLTPEGEDAALAPLLLVRHASIGSLAEYNSPANIRWQWQVAVTGDAGVSLDMRDLVLAKKVVAEMNYSELFGRAGFSKPQNIALRAVFHPNIYRQAPSPPFPTYSAIDPQIVTDLSPHPNHQRPDKPVFISFGSPGETLVTGSLQNISTSCHVTVAAYPASAEFVDDPVLISKNYLYNQDFNSIPPDANDEPSASGTGYSAAACKKNFLGPFYKYNNYYSMTKQAILADPADSTNHYLELWCFCRNTTEYARKSDLIISNEPISGDYTMSVDVLYTYTNRSRMLRIMPTMRDTWQPSEFLSIADFSFNQRHLFTGIQSVSDGDTSGKSRIIWGVMDHDPVVTSGWQRIKIIKAGDGLYYKFWLRDGAEPEDWDIILWDERLAANDPVRNALWFCAQKYSGNSSKEDPETRMWLDNIRISQNVRTAYQVNATVEGSGGTVEPTGSAIVQPGASHTITLKPAEGYKVASLKDGATEIDLTDLTPVEGGYSLDPEIGAWLEYSLENITADHEIKATFVELPKYTVTFEDNVPYTVITVPDSQEVYLGRKLSPVASPVRPWFKFTGWYKDAACTQSFDVANDTVDENMTLYAGWEWDAWWWMQRWMKQRLKWWMKQWTT